MLGGLSGEQARIVHQACTQVLPELHDGRVIYGTITVNSPGVTNWMTPPQMHINVEVLSKVGKFPNITVGAPGTQGAGVFGTQGMGVRTPMAADVAAATVGFAGQMHIPKGMMLVIGMWSMMLASGTCWVITLLVGRTTSELGATPKVHIIIAPMHTCIAIEMPPDQLRVSVQWCFH